MPTVAVSASVDTLISAGQRGRQTFTLVNTDPANAIYLRAFKRNANATTSTNYSYYIGTGQPYIARVAIEGQDLAESAYYALAVAGTPTISWEGSPN